jgi:hypothetical protein
VGVIDGVSAGRKRVIRARCISRLNRKSSSLWGSVNAVSESSWSLEQ